MYEITKIHETRYDVGRAGGPVMLCCVLPDEADAGAVILAEYDRTDVPVLGAGLDRFPEHVRLAVGALRSRCPFPVCYTNPGGGVLTVPEGWTPDEAIGVIGRSFARGRGRR